MVQTGRKMVHDGALWCKMVQDGAKMGGNGARWRAKNRLQVAG